MLYELNQSCSAINQVVCCMSDRVDVFNNIIYHSVQRQLKKKQIRIIFVKALLDFFPYNNHHITVYCANLMDFVLMRMVCLLN